MDWKKLLSSDRIRKSNPNDKRNPFESDFGRIIYSPALRRMHDKTQVFPLTTDDNIHSRLTHSNEVMSLGYTFGMLLCNNEGFVKRIGFENREAELLRIIPIIIQNVCLIHDIGNSPFGHFGETIISNYFERLEKSEMTEFCNLNEWQKRDFLNYDGNAQGLRVLTKLQTLNDPYGLNLTYSTLASSLKYPNFDIINSIKEKSLAKEGKNLENKFIENKKHGVFFSEKEYFELIIANTGLKIDDRVVRHPLCYLMEAADSIAYYCMDMEDGFNKGIYNIEDIKKEFENKDIPICKSIIQTINTKYVNDSFKIVNIRIKLIQYFVNLAFEKFIENLDLIEKGEYNKELVEDDKDEVYEIVSGFSKRIFKSREINNLESTGYSVMVGLLDFYIDFVFKKQNDKFINKAEVLISNSIIDAAIEETLIETCERKITNRLTKLRADYKLFSQSGNSNNKLTKELDKYEEMEILLNENKDKYTRLIASQKTEYIPTGSPESLELAEIRGKLLEKIKPEFKDLDNYYKFRVIVDFISGMTDQYAVKHYQRISGQRIN